MSTSLRDAWRATVPPWLLDFVGERLGHALTVVLDAGAEKLEQGIKARFPGVGPDDALPYIGADRSIDRGPNESASSYVNRLRAAIDTHRVNGSARALLEQLRAYFAPTLIPLRIVVRRVSDRANWHEIDPASGDTTKTNVTPSNWTWDAFTTRYFRAWLVIDSSSGPWTLDRWGDPGDWGDGGVWGSSATPTEITSVLKIVRRWKSAKSYFPAPLLIFDPTLFARGNSLAANVNGTGDDDAWRAALDANFLAPVRT